MAAAAATYNHPLPCIFRGTQYLITGEVIMKKETTINPEIQKKIQKKIREVERIERIKMRARVDEAYRHNIGAFEDALDWYADGNR